MKEIESIASALFDKIRSRFDNVTLGDEKAKAATDPTKARFFNFTYTDENGAEFGKVTLSLIDEKSLKIYFGQAISSDMDRNQRHNWYEFLRNLRKFAKRNNLSYDVRDINKDSLELQDIKQQAKADDVYTANDIKVTESKLYGTSRNSYSDMGECRLVIKHDGLVNDEVRGDRARKIRDIFIETSRGERFLVPFKNLDGARALCMHLNDGGTMTDERAEHITELVKEMSAMRHFVRSAKHRQFEDQETADMTRSAVHHYDQVKRTLRQMCGARGYRSYFESYTGQNPVEDDVDVDALRERFVKKLYDARFDEALPYVYRAYRQQTAEDYGIELEEWVDDVLEDTWSRPDNSDKVRAMQELLKSPVLTGIDGIDAQTKIGAIIGDDDLDDAIRQLAQSQGPDADSRSLVKTWVKQHQPDLLGQLEFGDNNGSDDKTNFAPAVSPEVQNNEYGTSADTTINSNNMTYESKLDSLDFIRNLAGLRK